MLHAAEQLAASVSYRSAGTVEFLVDVATDTVAFLEVNARLQVEHTVTEAVWGVDLVEWMVRIAAGDASVMDAPLLPNGHAIEARICAENPWRGHEPSAGTLSSVSFPADVRADTWVESGSEVTANYDSLLAKVVTHGATRAVALQRLRGALAEARLEGVTTNLDLLRAALDAPAFAEGRLSTSLLTDVRPAGRAVEVVTGGTMTTVQDYPGRLGYWAVGVPPSGPMDDRSFRAGNRIVGNAEGTGSRAHRGGTAPALPRRRDGVPRRRAELGHRRRARLPMWEAVEIAAGATVGIDAIGPPGLRAYLLVRGGIDVSPVLGSASTFTLGGFGGYAGRALRTGDVLRLAETGRGTGSPPGDHVDVPEIADDWEIDVLVGPHGDEEFLTAGDIDTFYATSSARAPQLRTNRCAAHRPESGVGAHRRRRRRPASVEHPRHAVRRSARSTSPATCRSSSVPTARASAASCARRWSRRRTGGSSASSARRRRFASCPLQPTTRARNPPPGRRPRAPAPTARPRDSRGGILDSWPAQTGRPSVTWRRSGDDYLLVEYGPMVLDLELRFRVHALQQWLEEAAPRGIVDVTPGIRSLQLHFDTDAVDTGRVLDLLQSAESELPPTEATEVASRTVHLPLSWDDPTTREAIHRYMSTVRADAPWCPWNIEFIRRINGLDSVDDVKRIVYDAPYLVLGLGDVYLGAPVATPIDPRHRLVTTKYNPARTWTPENAVGIGGAYLCVYGMEGPGGYQFVGRTVPVWNRFRRTADFTEPWLLRFFDQLRFFEVSAEELLDWRRDVLTGRAELRVEHSTLRLADHLDFVRSHTAEIGEFRARQQDAFNAERGRWAEAGARATRRDARSRRVRRAVAAGCGRDRIGPARERVESGRGGRPARVGRRSARGAREHEDGDRGEHADRRARRTHHGVERPRRRARSIPGGTRVTPDRAHGPTPPSRRRIAPASSAPGSAAPNPVPCAPMPRAARAPNRFRVGPSR